MKCVSDASGIIPQIALISGSCTGMAATIAAMFDFTVAAEEQATDLTALVTEDPTAAVRSLVELLPRNNKDVNAVEPTDDIGRPVALDTGVASIADNAALTTLYADMGKEITAALCRMGGETVGLVALNGKLTADGARKAARLVSFCDSFSIPVVTLVDSEGVEYADAANAFAKLAKAYVTATTAKVTAVIGKAFIHTYILFGSVIIVAESVFIKIQRRVAVRLKESLYAARVVIMPVRQNGCVHTPKVLTQSARVISKQRGLPHIKQQYMHIRFNIKA
jgi:acetyl-CoA carboxylase carboxyltransferase component